MWGLSPLCGAAGGAGDGEGCHPARWVGWLWAGMWYCGAASCAVHSAVVVQGPETLPELREVEGSLLWVRSKGCECWQP